MMHAYHNSLCVTELLHISAKLMRDQRIFWSRLRTRKMRVLMKASRRPPWTEMLAKSVTIATAKKAALRKWVTGKFTRMFMEIFIFVSPLECWDITANLQRYDDMVFTIHPRHPTVLPDYRVTRSLGALRAPTSSWRSFHPSRPSGAQAAWPTLTI